MASTGNMQFNLVNLRAVMRDGVGLSNSTRGIFAGGTTGTNTNVIEYITIAT